MKFDFKAFSQKLIPHFIAIGVFLIVAIFYTSPEFLDGKSLSQGDNTQWRGMANEMIQHNQSHPENPTQWTGSLFSGMPGYMIAVGTASAITNFFIKAVTLFLDRGTSTHHIYILMLGFYIMMSCFRSKTIISILGAVAYAFSTYNLLNLEAGHDTKLWAIAYAPIILGGLHLTFSKEKDRLSNMIGGGVIILIGMLLELHDPHYQITFYLGFVCAFYVLNQLVFGMKEKGIKEVIQPVAVALFAVIVALSGSTGKLLLTQEYAPYSTRGKAELTPIDRVGDRIKELEKKGTLTSEEQKEIFQLRKIKKEEKKQGEDGVGKGYAFQWSQGKMESFTMLIPNFYGDKNGHLIDEDSQTRKWAIAKMQEVKGLIQAGQIPKQYEGQIMQQLNRMAYAPGTYWGDQPFTGGALYVGAVICFLFLLGMMVLEDKTRWWILAGVVITLMFAWGRNLEWFNYFMFDYFPAFNKFRSVSMAVSITAILMTLTALLTIDKIFSLSFESYEKKLYISAGVLVGLCLLFWTGFGLSFESPVQNFEGSPIYEGLLSALITDRQSMLQSDALRSVLFIVLAFGVIWAWGKKIYANKTILFAGLTLLMFADLFLVAKRYVNNESYVQNHKKKDNGFKPSKADKKILKDKALGFRVMDLTVGDPFQSARSAYFHRDIGGYSPVKMQRYKELIDRKLNPELQNLRNGITQQSLKASSVPTMNMLNMKYVLYNDQNPLKINAGYGAAWFVNKVDFVKNPDEEMKHIGEVDLKTTAVIDNNKFKLSKNNFGVDSTASVEMTSYAPNHLEYTYNTSQAGMIVFSEVYYEKGWNVLLDGKPYDKEMLRANYILRALEVPAGKHTIEMVFAPENYALGQTLNMIATIVISIILLLAFAFLVKRTIDEGEKIEKA